MKSADGRICVSIGNCTVQECLAALEGPEMAEIRMETVSGLTGETVRKVFSARKSLIAACRPGKLKDVERKGLLLSAVGAGAAYVDVEVDAPDEYKDAIVKAAKAAKCKVIVSYHDYQKTPVKEELAQIVEWCFESGADIAKIACKANSGRDSARLLGLLDSEKQVIAIGMGEMGKITRVAAPFLGSPFTFASLAGGKETAEGQIGKERMEKLKEEIRRA